MSSVAFLLIAILTIFAAFAAATLPRLIHAALVLAAMFVGLAGFFFLLGAEFVGLVQIFVYVGAVAILIVFTILLTRRETKSPHLPAIGGTGIAAAVFAGLTWSIYKTPALRIPAPPAQSVSVKQIGELLMSGYVWPLLCVGVLLTAALIGAMVLVIEDKPK
jgi:NADH:ubiquinone oxidoreductase subunit 6 (subunit J)